MVEPNNGNWTGPLSTFQPPLLEAHLEKIRSDHRLWLIPESPILREKLPPKKNKGNRCVVLGGTK